MTLLTSSQDMLIFTFMAGQQDDNGVFTGSCKGDSGGPLKTQFVDSKRDTLIGIVSGGVGCGNGIPGWYTKVHIKIFLWKELIYYLIYLGIILCTLD